MGMGKLAEIVELFKKEGKVDIPIAIIQNGTRQDEKLGIGTIGTIEQIVLGQKLSNPAIIVVGEVVKHRSAVLNYAQTLKISQGVL